MPRIGILLDFSDDEAAIFVVYGGRPAFTASLPEHVLFRRKIYVAGLHHKDALDLAFAGMSQHQVRRIYDRVMDGKEEIVFGTACEDGSGFEACIMQLERKVMYGFHELGLRHPAALKWREVFGSAPPEARVRDDAR